MSKHASPITLFAKCKSGVASVELSIVMPVLVLAFLLMVDVSFAINNRMHLDTAMRTAAESALTDPGTATVEKVFDATKVSSPDSSEISFATSVDFDMDVERYCLCPGSAAHVSCTNACADTSIPYLFYELDGSGNYSGIFLPSQPISRKIVVQIR
jgi:TadE-like protein